jgi:hypothetical protein
MRPLDWYQLHREDYEQVQERLRACRNVMLHGRMDSAVEMLRKSSVFAVLSIQTERERHEKAFTMWQSGLSLEFACQEVVYENQKHDWLQHSLATVDFESIIYLLRQDGPLAALDALQDSYKGLSWTKGAFALAMIGMWELACPDTRTQQQLGIEHKINSYKRFSDALDQIDAAIDVDVPLFVKQWVLYDNEAQEHARHMAFYREVNEYLC